MDERWYTIGSFTFPSTWGAIIASFILTFLFLYFWNRKASDWYSNGIFYFLVIWKLSVIVVDFHNVIEHPITILYFNGGRWGYWLGLLSLLLYIFVKRADRTFRLVIAWMSTVVFFELVFRLLESNILAGVSQFIINCILILFLLKKENDRDTWAIQLVIVFTLFQLLLHSVHGGFVFTTVTWTYLIVMVYLIFLNGRWKTNIE
ncbi:hypothetical protein B0G93_11429 [Bacillus sp. V-88]|nr:hypothetical protein B1B00_13975 [Bacillus sp. DSM 27956]PRX75384.1 hypothetical protein B0G93_11429 [Bacillus sp. V-88]SLK23603.1 hypothetical protein SAMN06295884_11429 [Bacillus sp. V-88]